MRKIVLEVLGVVFSLAIAATARAEIPATGANQNFPVKPLRMFVGYPPGGGVDVAARLVSTALNEYWGVPIVVETGPAAPAPLRRRSSPSHPGTAIR